MNPELESTEAPEGLQYVKLTREFFVQKPQKTFFYERPLRFDTGEETGKFEIFACNEQEAARFGRFHKLVGVSDGTTYVNYIKSLGLKIGQKIEYAKARQILKDAFDAEFAVAKGKKSVPVYNAIHSGDGKQLVGDQINSLPR